MNQKVWALLSPYRSDYLRFLTGVVIRQALLVLGGYSLVWVLRVCMGGWDVPTWIFVAGFLAFDFGLLALDININTLYAKRLSFPMFARLRKMALHKVFQMPLEWHHQRDSGELVGQVNNGVGKVVQTAEGVSRELLPLVIRTALSLVPLLWFSPLTTPAVLGALAVFLFLTAKENQRRQPYRKSRYQNYARDFGLFSECVQYVQPLVQFGQTDRVMQRYGRVQDQIVEQGLEEVRVGNSYAWRRNLILSTTKRLCQGIWIYQFREHALDLGMVMYLNMLTEELLNSFWGYASLLERLYDGMEPARILIKLLNERPSIREVKGARPVALPERVGLELVNINFGYAKGRQVFQNFNLSVKPGTVLGIVGRSGMGKTTLHQLLSRMFEPQSGSIQVSGQDIRTWPLEQLRGLFSYVTQNGGVFFSNTSILNTIRFARPDATFREVVQAAKLACIHDDIVKLPGKYQTKVGQRGVTLSKGQQQRVALAQALVALGEERKVLVLDEFTSALDSQTEAQLLRNLLPLLKDKTVIIIAHRLATLKHAADKIVVIDERGIVEEGRHEELIRQGGCYAEMAKLQAVA